MRRGAFGQQVLAAVALTSTLAWSAPAAIAASPGRPTQPERLAAPVSDDATRLSCGNGSLGQSFPRAALLTPTGAEQRVGPEYDALRERLAPGPGQVSWREVARGARWVLFLAERDSGTWIEEVVQFETDPTLPRTGWIAWDGPNDCRLRVIPSADSGTATWALDPAYPAPTADATDLHLLAWEDACSSGRPTTGRNATPVVRYDDETVTITLGVRPIASGGTCQGTEGSPVILTLDEPLGTRSLLDGSFIPPRIPDIPRPFSPVVLRGSPIPSPGR